MKKILILAVLCSLLAAGDIGAKSALSPRHSGIEPPGGPRPLEALPGSSPSRTAEGGMGYVDAYGNTVTRDERQEAPKARKRLSPGAYGGYARQEPVELPEKTESGPPLWKFQ